jgi:hypothetical protein
METIQGQIEITRQQIISQLQDEISHFQVELGKFPTDSNKEEDNWGARIYQTIIARKRQLISNLS